MSNAIDNNTIQSIGDEIFDLYGVVVHMGGGCRSGHYFSYCRVGDKWYCFNDSSVTEMPEHNVLQGLKQAYMVVYEEQ